MIAHKLEKILQAAGTALNLVASVALAAMMFMMAADVIGRYLLNKPLPGALEMTEYFMAILVPLGIAYCATQRSHIAVDMIVEKLPPLLRALLNLFTKGLSIAFLLVLAWQGMQNSITAYHSKMTSAVLHLPSFPFTVPAVIGLLHFAVIMLVQLFLKRPAEDDHDTH